VTSGLLALESSVSEGGRRVLVAHNKPELLRALDVGLSAAGYEVQTADTARTALEAAASCGPEAIILDLSLPDANGTDLLHELRSWSSAPLMIVSESADAPATVAALDAGADAYLTKPFGIAELLARLRALLRRTGSSREPVLEFGALVVDLEKKAVTLAGEPVYLTPHEFRLLRVLAVSDGKLLTRQVILREVWGREADDDCYLLHTYVSQIRRKIEPDRKRPRYLLTVRGVGYRLSC
jgi:two-component system KDP operon response regulator KdpE